MQDLEKAYAEKWLKKAVNSGHPKAPAALDYLQENEAPPPPLPRDDGSEGSLEALRFHQEAEKRREKKRGHEQKARKRWADKEAKRRQAREL